MELIFWEFTPGSSGIPSAVENKIPSDLLS